MGGSCKKGGTSSLKSVLDTPHSVPSSAGAGGGVENCRF